MAIDRDKFINHLRNKGYNDYQIQLALQQIPPEEFEEKSAVGGVLEQLVKAPLYGGALALPALGEIVGGALRYPAERTEIPALEPLSKAGKYLQDISEQYRKKLEETYGKPEEYGAIPRTIISGFEMAGPTIGGALGIHGLLRALGVGGRALPILTSAGVGGMFGAAEAEEVLKRAKERGVPAGVAPELAGGVEALLEVPATHFLLKWLKPEGQRVLKGFPKMVSNTLTKVGIGKDAAREIADFLTIYAIEGGTEFAQNYLEAAIEKTYNIRPEAVPIVEGLAALGPTLVMTLLARGMGKGAVEETKPEEVVPIAEPAPERVPIPITQLRFPGEEFAPYGQLSLPLDLIEYARQREAKEPIKEIREAIPVVRDLFEEEQLPLIFKREILPSQLRFRGEEFAPYGQLSLPLDMIEYVRSREEAKEPTREAVPVVRDLFEEEQLLLPTERAPLKSIVEKLRRRKVKGVPREVEKETAIPEELKEYVAKMKLKEKEEYPKKAITEDYFRRLLSAIPSPKEKVKPSLKELGEYIAKKEYITKKRLKEKEEYPKKAITEDYFRRLLGAIPSPKEKVKPYKETEAIPTKMPPPKEITPIAKKEKKPSPIPESVIQTVTRQITKELAKEREKLVEPEKKKVVSKVGISVPEKEKKKVAPKVRISVPESLRKRFREESARRIKLSWGEKVKLPEIPKGEKPTPEYKLAYLKNKVIDLWHFIEHLYTAKAIDKKMKAGLLENLLRAENIDIPEEVSEFISPEYSINTVINKTEQILDKYSKRKYKLELELEKEKPIIETPKIKTPKRKLKPPPEEPPKTALSLSDRIEAKAINPDIKIFVDNFNKKFYSDITDHVHRIIGNASIEVVDKDTLKDVLTKEISKIGQKWGVEKARSTAEKIFARHGQKITNYEEFKEAIKKVSGITLISGDNIRIVLTKHSTNPVWHTAFHEIMEALVHGKYLNENDYRILERTFTYGERAWTENVADAFATYATIETLPNNLKNKSIIKSIFDRIKNFLEKLENLIRGNSFRSVNDIFRDALEGRYRREPEGIKKDVVTDAFLSLDKSADNTIDQSKLVMNKLFDDLKLGFKGYKLAREYKSVPYLAKFLPLWSLAQQNKHLKYLHEILRYGEQIGENILYNGKDLFKSIKDLDKTQKDKLSFAYQLSDIIDVELSENQLRELGLDDKSIEVYRNTKKYFDYMLGENIRYLTALNLDAVLISPNFDTIPQNVKSIGLYIRNNIDSIEKQIDKRLREYALEETGKDINLLSKQKRTQLKNKLFSEEISNIIDHKPTLEYLRANPKETARVHDMINKLYEVCKDYNDTYKEMIGGYYIPRVRPQGRYAVKVMERIDRVDKDGNPEKIWFETYRIHTDPKIIRTSEATQALKIRSELIKKLNMPYVIIKDESELPKVPEDRLAVMISENTAPIAGMFERLPNEAIKLYITKLVTDIREKGGLSKEEADALDRIFAKLRYDLTTDLKSRSFIMRRFIARKSGVVNPLFLDWKDLPKSRDELDKITKGVVTLGYESGMDIYDVIKEYAVAISNSISRMVASHEFYKYTSQPEVVSDLKRDPNLFYELKTREQSLLISSNPLAKWTSLVKSIVVNTYIGFRISTALIQLTQEATVGIPSLSPFEAMTKEELRRYGQTSPAEMIRFRAKSIFENVFKNEASKYADLIKAIENGGGYREVILNSDINEKDQKRLISEFDKLGEKISLEGLKWHGKALERYLEANKIVFAEILESMGMGSKKGSEIPENIRRAINRFKESRGYTTFAMSLKQETSNLPSWLAKFSNASLYLIQMAEEFSRKSGFVAAYMLAKEKGMGENEAIDFGLKHVDEAYFIFGKLNRPSLFLKHEALSPLLTLRTYTVNYWGWIYSALKNNYGRVYADKILLSTAYMMLLGGVFAVPLVGELIELIGKILGIDVKHTFSRTIRNSLGKGAGRLAEYGILAPIFGVDISPSIRVELLPQDLSVSGIIDYTFGTLRSSGYKMDNFISSIQRGDWTRAFMALSPTVVERSLMVGGHYIFGHPLRTSYGKTITTPEGVPIKLSTLDVAYTLLGFKPMTISEPTSVYRATRTIEMYMKKKRDKIYEKLKFANSYEEIADIIETKVNDYNERAMRYGGAVPLITPVSITRVLKSASGKPNKLALLLEELEEEE